MACAADPGDVGREMAGALLLLGGSMGGSRGGNAGGVTEAMKTANGDADKDKIYLLKLVYVLLLLCCHSLFVLSVLWKEEWDHKCAVKRGYS